MADRYVYPALFYHPEEDPSAYVVHFPDLDVYTQGKNLTHALDMAKELLELTLFGLEEDGEKIPAASDPSTLDLNQPGAFVTLVSVYMPVVRAEMAHQFVRKTVTLPKWLNDVAETAGINFSRSLQTAIRLKLEVSPPPKKPGPDYDLERRGRRRVAEKV
jgi:predicted RNase H-like HicB family nuclease